MTYIFISYCHKDRDSLESVLQTLKDNGFSPDEVWFDDDIEAGNQWIPQIDTALREAYAVIVIVTPDSMRSTYVAYEWSAAIGSSTTLFPLLCKGDYNDIHTRLLQEQVVDCRKGIPSSLIDLVKSKRSTPPDTNYLNWKISETLMRFRIATLITLWFYGQISHSPHDKRQFRELVTGMLDEARDLYSLKLPELIVSRACAFNQKQLRMCRILISELGDYWKIFKVQVEDYDDFFVDGSPQDSALQAIEYWNTNLRPSIDFFSSKRQLEEDAYVALESYLSELAQHRISDEIHSFLVRTTIIDWRFDKNDEYGNLLRETIQKVVEGIRGESPGNIGH